jgi:acyl carrier protein
LDDIPGRLVRCFSAVFPDLPREKIPEATPETVSSWDSVGMVTLIALIEEEFGLVFKFEDHELMTSYSGILGVLEERLAA